MNKTWYLGPLGNLRGLVCPERGMTDTLSRYGGVHQALSGSRTMDITGFRREFEFAFNYLDRDEFEWLYALHTRMVPGPFYLLDPRYKNRLSSRATTLYSTYNDERLGLQLDGGVTRTPVRDFPSDLSYGTLSLSASPFSDGDSVACDAGTMVPVLDGESLTGSWYLRAVGDTPSQDVSLSFDFYDADRNQQGSSAPTQFTATESWSRATHTATIPDEVAAVVLRLTFSTYNSEVRMAAPMVESGSSATEWEQGKASAMVLADQLSTSSPLFPLTDCTLTLLEA